MTELSKKLLNYKGKNLIFFDLETTGLPLTPRFGEYYSFTENDKYNSSRIVSIAWCLITNYPEQNFENIVCKHYIRKVDNDIKITNNFIHGITNEISNTKGIDLKIILDEFIIDLEKSDYLVAHNINFDYNILLNEVYRLKKIELSNSYMDILLSFQNKLLCTCSLFKNICKIKQKNGLIKLPKLSEVYEYMFNELPEVSHSADHDVINLVKILLEVSFD